MTIDKICKMTTSTEMLNALHACRKGHPWNTPDTNHFREAWFLAQQHPSYKIGSAAVAWLKKQGESLAVPRPTQNSEAK